MQKLMVSLMATLSLVTVASCKKKGGGGDALAKMEGFSKSMCECKDKACADKVNADMTAWGTEMAKTADKDAKPDPDMAKKSADIMTKYTECMTKLMMAGAGGDKGSAKEPPPDKGSAAMPPPDKGSAAAKEPHKPLEAFAKVPAQPTKAKVGQMAWVLRGTVFDSPDSFRVDVDEVTAVDGNTVTSRPTSLIASGPDSWKHKPNPDERPYAGLPGMLVIPVRTVDEIKPKAGDIVWAYLGNTTTPELTTVKSVENGLVTYETPNAMKDKIEEHKTDLIEPVGKGVAPFGIVAFKEGDDWKTMTVLAVQGDKVFGWGYGGKLVEQKKSAVKPITPVLKDRKVGDKVYVLGNPKPEDIKEIVVPKHLFKTGIFTRTWDEIFDKATP